MTTADPVLHTRPAGVPAWPAAAGASLHHDLADWLATPRLAQAWSDVIVDCWLAAEAAGAVDVAQPFTVLDLAPGNGRLRALLLPRLQHRLAALGRGHWQVDYRDDDQVAAPGANPAVWLAAGALGQPLPAFYGVHYESTLCGALRVAPAETPHTWKIDCDWQPVDASVIDALPGNYRAHLNSAGFSVPLAALSRLDALARTSASRFLLLAVDYGVVEARDVRLGLLHPPATFTEGCDRLPLNLHAISCHLRGQGAWTWADQQHAGGAVLYLAWHDASSNGSSLLPVLAERLAGSCPDAHLAALDAARHLPPWLGLLQDSAYDPEVCACMLPALCEALPEDPVLCAAWRQALRRVAERAAGMDADTLFDLARAARLLGDLALARRLLHALREQWPAHPVLCQQLAEVEVEAGRADLALPLLHRVLDREPEHEAARALLPHCEARTAGTLLRDGELTLEPLGAEHAAALFVQYRDPQIGMMTRLPDIDSCAAMAGWLAELAATPHRQNFAVMHADAGAIGVVAVAWHGTAGYLHFWLGTDWQGHGLAARAVRLMLGAMPDDVQLYTSVYCDNHRSLRVLERLGFTSLDCRAEEPDEGLVFLHWQGGGDVAGLGQLLQGLESPIVLAAGPWGRSGSRRSRG